MGQRRLFVATGVVRAHSMNLRAFSFYSVGYESIGLPKRFRRFGTPRPVALRPSWRGPMLSVILLAYDTTLHAPARDGAQLRESVVRSLSSLVDGAIQGLIADAVLAGPRDAALGAIATKPAAIWSRTMRQSGDSSPHWRACDMRTCSCSPPATRWSGALSRKRGTSRLSAASGAPVCCAWRRTAS